MKIIQPHPITPFHLLPVLDKIRISYLQCLFLFNKILLTLPLNANHRQDGSSGQ